MLNNFILSQIEDSIIKTLCWFDVFDYPLTKEEVWRYGLFIDPLSQSQVTEALERLLGQEKIASKENFFHLLGRAQIIAERKMRYNYADLKFKRALAVTKLFRFVPSVELVAIGNLIGSHNLGAKGDIDLLVITRPGTIWATRFALTAIVKILGLRPSREKTENTICLSFYATSEALNFERIANPEQLYFFYWLAFLTPIYDKVDFFERLQAENVWIKERLPNFFVQKPSQIRTVRRRTCLLADWLFAAVFPLEEKFKELELELLPAELRQIANTDSRVVINDRMLKFHANDRRLEFQEKYKECLRAFHEN